MYRAAGLPKVVNLSEAATLLGVFERAMPARDAGDGIDGDASQRQPKKTTVTSSREPAICMSVFSRSIPEVISEPPAVPPVVL